jgi:S-DNA-T family DNA segregation ATPase FtsK/SpoIIIE
MMRRLRGRPTGEFETPSEIQGSESPVDKVRPEPRPAREQSASPQTRFVIEDTVERPPTPAESPPRPNGKDRDQLPAIDLLDKVVEADFTEADNEQRARLIEKALDSYGVDAKVMQINPGPSVTQFGVEPGWDRKYKRLVERDQQGKVKLDKDGNPTERLEEISRTRVKVERITSLAQNLALALAVHSIRIEAPVPGKPLVGIEVPNSATSLVLLKSVIESHSFQRTESKSKLALALGKGAAGEALAADLARMPHLLIAGTTGSGKTVFINSIVTCLLMHNRPQDLRLLLIDPKRVELVQFDGVPHLISPVVKEIDRAVDSLRRVIKEMDNRYKEFAAVGVRNIEGYNRSQLITEPLPYLVVIVDELNQLMMTAAEVVEASVCRLAQLSRATGIHLVVATQRPSVDVVTGLIKANFPTRIAFTVPSIMDSRTILDTGGAEKLLGMGDMLYLPSDVATPKRLRGCFVSDHEIDKVVRFWKQAQDTYEAPMDDTVATAFASLAIDETTDDDSLLPAARRLAKDTSHISTSLIQRRLHVGYPRAARIMDALEREGLIVRGDLGSPAEVIEADEEEE